MAAVEWTEVEGTELSWSLVSGTEMVWTEKPEALSPPSLLGYGLDDYGTDLYGSPSDFGSGVYMPVVWSEVGR